MEMVYIGLHPKKSGPTYPIPDLLRIEFSVAYLFIMG